MIVCIAEKPSVAAEIAKVLGANSRRDGFFEGNGYQITWTFGHLCTLKEPHDYQPDLRQWRIETLPIVPKRFSIKLIDKSGIEKQFKTIETLVTKATEVVNCGDAGQEGELIQRWVLLKAQCRCPVKRLWINSLTEEAIAEGFKSLRNANDFQKLYEAGSSRAIGDWLLGINATRLYTLKFAQPKQVLSIGRVQTPTLALIVARHFEIENFKPEQYWELKTTYRDVIFNAASGRFKSKEDAQGELAKITGKPFTITDYSTKEGTESAPRLFDLTSLQVECNKKFGMSADDTLKTIQSLYEKKLTTYPRVDTTYLSDDIYPKVESTLKGLTGYADLVEPLLKSKIRKSKKVFDNSKVTDHHAIIPTGQKPGVLSKPEQDVYDQVCRRFIANFYPDSKISTTNVEGVVEGITFKTSGKQIIEPAWRVVFPQQKSAGDENIMPIFVIGESGPHTPDLQEKFTQPPKLYTEATLLRAMETAGKQVDDEELRDLMKDNGIGRPSTRAAIIETLFRRNYIRKDKKNLIPTITGIQLIGVIKNDLLKSVELTGLWERKLRMIEKGEYDVATFMDEMKQMVADVVREVRSDYSTPKIESVKPAEHVSTLKKSQTKSSAVKSSSTSNDELICPRCGLAHFVKGKTAWGCANYANGCKTVIPFEFAGKRITDSQIKQLLKKHRTSLVKGLTLNSETFDGYICLNDDFNLETERAEEKKLICPKCNSGVVMKGNKAFGCSNYKNGCNFRIPFEVYGKTLTQANVEQLVLKGKTSKLSGFKTGADQNISCVLQFDSDFNIVLEKTDK